MVIHYEKFLFAAGRGTKTLCKHCGFVLLLSRHGWGRSLVMIGPRRDQIRDRSPETRPPRSSQPQQRLDAIGDFIEVQSNIARATTLEKPLVANLVDDTPGALSDQLQGSGACLVPSGSCSDRPKPSRSRGTNKIDVGHEEVVDEAALQGMFKGYDRKADNVTDINLEGTGRFVAEMGAKQTHKLAIHLVSRAVHEVVLTAFTFDFAPLGEALKEAAARGVRVTVLADHGHTLSGTTQAMPSASGI